MNSRIRIYLGISLISATTLAFEIALTRIFSIAMWYHFAFMIVSIAMLGIGASGTFLMLYPSFKKPERLPFYSIFFSITLVLSYSIANLLPFDPVKLAWDTKQIFYIFLHYLIFGLPFFFSGLTITTALAWMAERAGRLYFFDLTGAGIGSLGALAIISYAGEGGSILVISSFALGATFLLNYKKNRGVKIFLSALALLLVLSFIYPPSFLDLRISPYKGLMTALRYPGARHLKTVRNSFSRVDLLESPAVRFAPGLSLVYQEPLPSQLGLAIDGGDVNAITRFDGRLDDIAFIDYLPSSLPYFLGKNDDVLILGPEGGLSILSALFYKSKRVEKIERNPLIVKTILEEYRDFAGGLYDKDTKIGLGRGIIKSSDRVYDIIDIPLTQAIPSSSGLYGFLEDYRFTEEAFMDYYTHLKEKGYLSITRYLLPPPRAELRFITTILSALERLGIKNPERQIAIIRSWGTINIILKRGSITKEDIKAIKGFTSKRLFDLVYYPGMRKEEANINNKFHEPIYFNLISKIMDSGERDRFLNDYLFDISPITDDRPFFYQYLRITRLKDIYESVSGKWQFFVLEGGYLVPLIFLQALVVSLLLILAPVVIKRRKKGGFRRFSLISTLIYFFALGLGFMFIEIPLIQRFILFLDQPIYAIATVLFGFLISSGFGSLISQRLSIENRLIWKGMILLLIVLIIIHSFSIPHLFELFLGLSLLQRELLTIPLLFTLGFFMGMPFPLGIRLLESKQKEYIPWAWAVNGCSSILSSILAVIVALSLGFSGVMLIGAVAYFVAFLSLTRL